MNKIKEHKDTIHMIIGIIILGVIWCVEPLRNIYLIIMGISLLMSMIGVMITLHFSKKIRFKR